MNFPELDRLADAVTALAGARERIPLGHLFRETALNILILTRIASKQLDDGQRRESIETACDDLVDQLRHIGRILAANTETQPPSAGQDSDEPPAT